MVRVKEHCRVQAPNLLFHLDLDLDLDHERTPRLVPRTLNTNIVAREGPSVCSTCIALTVRRINIPPQSAHTAAGAPHRRRKLG